MASHSTQSSSQSPNPGDLLSVACDTVIPILHSPFSPHTPSFHSFSVTLDCSLGLGPCSTSLKGHLPYFLQDSAQVSFFIVLFLLALSQLPAHLYPWAPSTCSSIALTAFWLSRYHLLIALMFCCVSFAKTFRLQGQRFLSIFVTNIPSIPSSAWHIENAL